LSLNFDDVGSNSVFFTLLPTIIERALYVNDILLDDLACNLLIKLMFELSKLQSNAKIQNCVQEEYVYEFWHLIFFANLVFVELFNFDRLWKRFSAAIHNRVIGIPFQNSKEMQFLMSCHIRPEIISETLINDYTHTLCQEISYFEQTAPHCEQRVSFI
jgi:hypothetical protein